VSRARRQDADEEDVCSLLGYVARAEGKLDEAEALWRKTLQLEPDHADAQLRLAFDRHESAALQGLQRYLELERYPAAEAHYLMGMIHLEQKNPTAAEDSFRKAVRARVDYGDALYQLGRLYQQQGREEEAITELLGELARLSPEPASAPQ
jgi:tetratricopeptide (TPR) repeat protein